MGQELRQADLVEDARRGDGDAWEVLYRAVYPRLRAYLSRRVGQADADDLVNETMARAVSGIATFELGPAGFDGWVFGIARHVAADHHRASHRASRIWHAVRASAPVPSVAAPEEGLLVSCDRTELRDAFARLAPHERELLELRLIAGLSAEQVAEITGKRPGAVRTAQSRALEHLRQIMTGRRG
ncbi:MAG: RNA polymerase sigma factor [Acidimicrobiales bacterium]